MLRDGVRCCDGCGQKLPAGSKLSEQSVAREEALGIGAAGRENPDGSVSIDLCLNCRIQRANRLKHGAA